jgi:hypothetical protein
MEKEESNNKFDRMREELMEELGTVQRDRDNSILMAENDKQQVCSFLLIDCCCYQDTEDFSL